MNRMKSRTLTKVAAIGAAAVMTSALAACGSTAEAPPSSSAAASTSAGETSPAASASEGPCAASLATAQSAVDGAMAPPSGITQTEALPAAPTPGGLVVQITDGNPDSLRINAGTEAAAKAVGWTYKSVPKDPANPASLQTALMTALAMKPTVVSQSGQPQTVISESVMKAYEAAGVPIILDSTYPVTSTKVIIGSSKEIADGYEYNKALGKVLADWFIVDSKCAGSAVIENVSGFPSLTGTPDGFKAEVEALCPDCKVTVVDVSLADVGAGKLSEQVVSGIRRVGAGYVFFDNGAFGIGIVPKLKAAGLESVKVGGVSPQPEEVAGLKDGTQSAWITIGFNYVGYATMDLVFRHLQNAPLTTNDAVQPTQLLLKANASDGAWDLPADSLDQFKKLWKVG